MQVVSWDLDFNHSTCTDETKISKIVIFKFCFLFSFNTSLNDSIAQLHTNKHTLPSRPCWSDPLERTAETVSPSASNADKELNFTVGTSSPSHPTKITLTDSSYYTIPTLDEMIQFIDGESCIVKDFAVGRKGYGQVMFPGETDVYGLNLDEIGNIFKIKIFVWMRF